MSRYDPTTAKTRTYRIPTVTTPTLSPIPPSPKPYRSHSLDQAEVDSYSELDSLLESLSESSDEDEIDVKKKTAPRRILFDSHKMQSQMLDLSNLDESEIEVQVQVVLEDILSNIEKIFDDHKLNIQHSPKTETYFSTPTSDFVSTSSSTFPTTVSRDTNLTSSSTTTITTQQDEQRLQNTSAMSTRQLEQP